MDQVSDSCVVSEDRAVQMLTCPVDRQSGARAAASPAHPRKSKTVAHHL